MRGEGGVGINERQPGREKMGRAWSERGKGVSDGLKGLLQETLESEMAREEKKKGGTRPLCRLPLRRHTQSPTYLETPLVPAVISLAAASVASLGPCRGCCHRASCRVMVGIIE